jgi:hypothetical protein
MKKLLANLLVVTGAAVAVIGIALTPFFRGYLPASLFTPGEEPAGHPYFIVTPSGPQGPDYLPYMALLLGAILLSVGLACRRKVRGGAS